MYLNYFPYTLPLEVTLQLFCKVHVYTTWLPPPYTWCTCTLSNDRRLHVWQRLLIHCYGHGYINDRTVFFSELQLYCQYAVFWVLIGPNITSKIIQKISKIWDEVPGYIIIGLSHSCSNCDMAKWLAWRQSQARGCASDLAIPQLIHELVW